VSVKESGAGDLVLSIAGTTDKITLRGQLLSAASGVDQVMFAAGTVTLIPCSLRKIRRFPNCFP
jgi:hypothetical protein